MDFTSANLRATKGYHRCMGLPTSDFLLVEAAALSLIGVFVTSGWLSLKTFRKLYLKA